MLRKFTGAVTWLACVAVLASACASQKEPARAAINEAEAALQSIAPDAQKYAPDQYQAVADELASAKASYDKGDYKAALATARGLPARINDVGAATTSAKNAAMEQLKNEWNTLSAEVPQMLEAIESRVTTLSKSRKLPKNVDQASFDSAKSGLETMKQDWAAATQASGAGNFEEAVARVKAAQQKGTEILALLKMQQPPPA